MSGVRVLVGTRKGAFILTDIARIFIHRMWRDCDTRMINFPSPQCQRFAFAKSTTTACSAARFFALVID